MNSNIFALFSLVCVLGMFLPACATARDGVAMGDRAPSAAFHVGGR